MPERKNPAGWQADTGHGEMMCLFYTTKWCIDQLVSTLLPFKADIPALYPDHNKAFEWMTMAEGGQR